MTTIGAVTCRQAVLRHLAATALIAAVVTVGVGTGTVRSARAAAERSAVDAVLVIRAAVLDTVAAANYSTADGYRRDQLLATLEPFLRTGALYRVKLWMIHDGTARIVVSNEPRLEGFTRTADGPLTVPGTAGEGEFPAGPPTVLAVPADDEHRFETQRRSRLMEVFTAFHDAAGNRLCLEAYVRAEVRTAAQQGMRLQAPTLLAAILGISGATLPLTVQAARRARRLAAARTDLAATAAAVRDRHQRDLARALHDGPIQHLAAAGVVLSHAELSRPEVTGPPSDADAVVAAGALVRGSIAQLRALTEGLLPAGVPSGDLADSLPRLLRLEVDDPAALHVHVPATVSSMIIRPHQVLLTEAAVELVRNAARHGRSSRITAAVEADVRNVVLTVHDNGAGFDPGTAPPAGHFGLTLLTQAVSLAGGTVSIVSAPGAGCSVSVTLPVTERH